MNSILDIINAVSEALENQNFDLLNEASEALSGWIIGDSERQALGNLICQAESTLLELEESKG